MVPHTTQEPRATLSAWWSAVALLLGQPALGDEPPPPPASTTTVRVYQFDAKALTRAKERAKAGDAQAAAVVGDLRRKADRELKAGPYTIVHKKKLPPSGDPHDYASLAPYFWPDPAQKDGLPYVRRDGRTNPERNQYDAPQLSKMAGATHTLALAYAFTGDERYAAHAAKLLRAWFLDPATRMNPNLNYGQFVPGRNNGRPTGIIETNRLLPVVDAVGLLAGSRAWTKEDQAGTEAWFRRYLDWLRTSKTGRGEAAATNNHGTWYDVQACTFALFVGDTATAKEVLEAAKATRIARQIEPDGRQPRELGRTKSYDYSQFNLDAFCALASLGERVGVDLWGYQTPDGRGIRKALDYLIPYATGEKPWPGQQIQDAKFSGLARSLRRAAVAYREPKYERLRAKLIGKAEPGLMDLLYPSFKPAEPRP